jgi:uncharacterized DUF497 family protein
MIAVYEFRWNAWNRDKCDKHNVSPREAEYVVNHPFRGYPARIEDDKFVVRGQTAEGAYLQVIYVVDVDGTLFVLHTRPLNENEKRALRRRRRR